MLKIGERIITTEDFQKVLYGDEKIEIPEEVKNILGLVNFRNLLIRSDGKTFLEKKLNMDLMKAKLLFLP